MKAHFDGPPPAEPQPIEDIYREYVEYVQPYQLGNSHPRFWGWVLGSGTPMGVIAEMLAAATDSVSGIYSYVSNNYVELQVLDWCKEMLGYPLGRRRPAHERVLGLEPDRPGRGAQRRGRVRRAG